MGHPKGCAGACCRSTNPHGSPPSHLVVTVATIIAVLVAAYFFEWVRILMAVIFLVSFLHFAWTQLKG